MRVVFLVIAIGFVLPACASTSRPSPALGYAIRAPETQPLAQARATWVPGHWRKVDRGMVWIEGHWS